MTKFFQLFFYLERFKVSNQLMTGHCKESEAFQSQPPTKQRTQMPQLWCQLYELNTSQSSLFKEWSYLARSNFCCEPHALCFQQFWADPSLLFLCCLLMQLGKSRCPTAWTEHFPLKKINKNNDNNKRLILKETEKNEVQNKKKKNLP